MAECWFYCKLQCGVVIAWLIFFNSSQKTHPIAHLWGQAMRCLLWVQTYIHILPQSTQWYIQYHINSTRLVDFVHVNRLQMTFFFLLGNVDPTRRYLFLQILGGKAFLEHLQDTEILPGHSMGPTFTLHLCFRGQRFKSRTVPCACEPDIKEGFLLEMHKESAGMSY